MANGHRVTARERISTTVGFASGGTGAFGSVHAVCHYTCEAIVAGLALAGVTLAGLPFAFLQDPKLIVVFSSMGVISLGLSILLHIKKRSSLAETRVRHFFDRKMAFLASFILLSAWSLGKGTLELVRAEGTPESATKVSKEGNVEVELTFLNLKDPKINLRDPKIKEQKAENVLIFDLAINSMDMSLSPFQAYDFKNNVVLESDRGVSVSPIDAKIADWGHMGHHPRGKLIFPSHVGGVPFLKSGVVRVVIKGLGGVEKRVFEWKIPRSQ